MMEVFQEHQNHPLIRAVVGSRKRLQAELVAPHLKKPGVRVWIPEKRVRAEQVIAQQAYGEIQCNVASRMVASIRNAIKRERRLSRVISDLTGGFWITPELLKEAGFFIFEGMHDPERHAHRTELTMRNNSQRLHRDGLEAQPILSLNYKGNKARSAKTTIGDAESVFDAAAKIMSENPKHVVRILDTAELTLLHDGHIVPSMRTENLPLEVNYEGHTLHLSPTHSYGGILGDMRVILALEKLAAVQNGVVFPPKVYRELLEENNAVGRRDISNNFVHELLNEVTYRVHYNPGTWLLIDDEEMLHGTFAPDNCPADESIWRSHYHFDKNLGLSQYMGGQIY